MKVLHIIGSMNPSTGGPCQGIRNLNKALEGLGIHREVVSLDSPDASFIGSDPFIIHALGPSRSAWQYSSRLFPWLVKNLQNYDIAIVNGLWLYHVHAVIKAIKLLKKKFNTAPKVFLMPHGMLDPYFQKASDRKIKKLRNIVYWNIIEKKNIQAADGLFFTCEVELQLARQTFNNYNPKKEINVGYGVDDVPAFSREMKTSFIKKCPHLDDTPFFLFLSRIHPKKGVDMLIAAYIELYKSSFAAVGSRKFPKLVIAGPGLDTAYGKNLLLLISKFREIESFIFFPGMLTGNEKWGALHMCEAFVLPSHQENFGIAVVEALACNKPVLISNQINIWKEIFDDNAGIVRDDTKAGTLELLDCWLHLSVEQKMEMTQKTRIVFENKFAIIPAAYRLINAFNDNFFDQIK